MTPTELRKRGFKALVGTLGCLNAVRFIQQYSLGDGDYTKERHQWLEQLNVNDFRSYVQRKHQQESFLQDNG